jgi:hypothetical protein
MTGFQRQVHLRRAILNAGKALPSMFNILGFFEKAKHKIRRKREAWSEGSSESSTK